MRAMQRMQFHAKSAKNDLKPTNFLKRYFYFETKGVIIRKAIHSKMGGDFHVVLNGHMDF